MQVQRKRILQMLEDGKISMDEALTLLENLQASGAQESAKVEVEQVVEQEPAAEERQEQQEQAKQESGSTRQEEPTVDDFLDDLRRDFTMAGDRFMQFMQTAVEKVKDIDLDSPFRKSFVFNHTLTKNAAGIERLALTIPSGKVTIHAHDAEEVRAEFTVKAYHKESESKEDAKEEVLKRIEMAIENDSLTIRSDIKIGQVDVDLYLPRKQYKRFEARLTNGALKARDLMSERIQVKTTNGEIQLNEVTSETIEAETLNGRVYLDGDVKEVTAQSLNGAVVVTTTNEQAEKINAKTTNGSIELYIPSTISLAGDISSTVGKLDLGLKDIVEKSEPDHLFQRTIHFSKEVADQSTKLRLTGHTRTGTVLVRYNI